MTTLDDSTVWSSFQEEPGIFILNLQSNHMQADTAAAEFFGLAPGLALSGLPVKAFFERVHLHDRLKLSKAFRDAIVSGDPFRLEFRALPSATFLPKSSLVGDVFATNAAIPAFWQELYFRRRSRRFNPRIENRGRVSQLVVLR